MSEARGGSVNPTQRTSRSVWLARVRSRIVAGLVLVLPIWITIVVVTIVFRIMRDASIWFVVAILLSPAAHPLLAGWGLGPEQLADEGVDALPVIVQWSLSALSVLLTVVALYVLGSVATNVVTARVIHSTERVLDRMPFIKTVYNASKKVLQAVAGDKTRPFRKVVLVPFPNREMHSVGFVTRVNQNQRTGETLYTVFVATAPNPTTGFVMLIRPDDVVELDWSVEEAVKAVMSGGVLMPDAVPLAATEEGLSRK